LKFAKKQIMSVTKRILLHGYTLGTVPQDNPLEESAARPRVFLLSPANASGVRAKQLFSSHSRFELAQRLRETGASLGEIFSFISGLYFRGKLTYAKKFSSSASETATIRIITPAAGLLPPSTMVTLEKLREITSGPVDPELASYRVPLDRDARELLSLLHAEAQVVLLGSIATTKYVGPLLEIFGERLVFPAEFVGRGDMSRGGLLLRASRSGTPLSYIPLSGAQRTGSRPPKLKKRKIKKVK
jgi:hypothetical protein